MVLDSRVGALDRTLGFLFGLGRGLIIVVVAFMFFAWLVPERSQPLWVSQAKSKVVLESTGAWLISISPDFEALYAKYRRPRNEDGEPADPPPDPSRRGASTMEPDPSATYGRNDRSGMRDLIETKTR
jgi:membrane protein required for colicin V production